MAASLLQALPSPGELSEIPCVLMVHLWASAEPQVTPEEVRAGEMKVLGQTNTPPPNPGCLLTQVFIHGPKKKKKKRQSFESINGTETVDF